jgi:hypothetical protein
MNDWISVSRTSKSLTSSVKDKENRLNAIIRSLLAIGLSPCLQ